jgi:hypothetical protein
LGVTKAAIFSVSVVVQGALANPVNVYTSVPGAVARRSIFTVDPAMGVVTPVSVGLIKVRTPDSRCVTVNANPGQVAAAPVKVVE